MVCITGEDAILGQCVWLLETPRRVSFTLTLHPILLCAFVYIYTCTYVCVCHAAWEQEYYVYAVWEQVCDMHMRGCVRGWLASPCFTLCVFLDPILWRADHEWRQRGSHTMDPQHSKSPCTIPRDVPLMHIVGVKHAYHSQTVMIDDLYEAFSTVHFCGIHLHIH